MSTNNNMYEREWTFDDLELDENDIALAAEILGFPPSNNSNEIEGSSVPQINTSASSLTLGQEPYGPLDPTISAEFSSIDRLEFPEFGDINDFNFSGPGSIKLPSPSIFLPVPDEAALDINTLIADKNNDWKGHITSYEEYLGLKDAYMKLHNDEPHGNILDFPATDHAQRDLVRRLYQAMTNMDDILDGTRLSRKRRHVDEDSGLSHDSTDAVGPFEDSVAVKRVKATSGIELELLSWELLYAIRDAQTGQDCMPAWSKDWERKRYDSFMDRFNEVVLSLTKAKTVVSSLLNVGFMKRLAAAPERELHRKKDNKRLNLDRDISVKAGNYARKQGLVNVNENNGIKAANGLEIAPANPMRNNQTVDNLGRRRRTSGGKVVQRQRPYQRPYERPADVSQSPAVYSHGSVPPALAMYGKNLSSNESQTLTSATVSPQFEPNLRVDETVQTRQAMGTPATSMSTQGISGFCEQFDMSLFPELPSGQIETAPEPTFDFSQPFDFGATAFSEGNMFGNFDIDFGLSDFDPGP